MGMTKEKLRPGMLFQVSDTGEIFLLLRPAEMGEWAEEYGYWDVLFGEDATRRRAGWIIDWGIYLGGGDASS